MGLYFDSGQCGPGVFFQHSSQAGSGWLGNSVLSILRVLRKQFPRGLIWTVGSPKDLPYWTTILCFPFENRTSLSVHVCTPELLVGVKIWKDFKTVVISSGSPEDCMVTEEFI